MNETTEEYNEYNDTEKDTAPDVDETPFDGEQEEGYLNDANFSASRQYETELRIRILSLAAAAVGNAGDADYILATAHRFQEYVNEGESYPRENGGVILLGPEMFTDLSQTVISWRGQNFYRIPDEAFKNDEGV